MNQNNIEQIKQELDNLAQKRKDIYLAIRAVDRLFSGVKNTCVKCGLIEKHVDHGLNALDNDKDYHEFVSSIYVGNLQEAELVYSIENSADLYITCNGLRFHPNATTEDVRNTLPSEWYADVRLEILNNLDQIIEGVLNAIKLQSERLKVYDDGIEKVNKVLQALKGSD